MKVIFPNPAGYKLPTKASVLAYQKQQGFSDQYAEFLITQNGFSFNKLEKNTENAKFISESSISHAVCFDVKRFFGYCIDQEKNDLVDFQENIDIFKGIFFIIGIGCGGDAFVEVLAGKYKGYIGSLDHGLYITCDSLDEFVDRMGLVGFQDASLTKQADIICDNDCGVIWLHAASIQEFVADCIHCDDEFNGFVRDADSVADIEQYKN